LAWWQTARSCGKVCGTLSPSFLNRSSFVKTAWNDIAVENPNSA
jgi:hypothetical protein